MCERVFSFIDKLSWCAAKLAELTALLLIASMLYEVGARYFFHAPTLWAFDIAYMSTGAMFVLGAAWTLRENAHVRVDFLSTRMPARFARWVDGGLFLLVLFPIFTGISWAAIRRAWRAWATNEVEMVSPWGPLMWPFYSILAFGLLMLTIQLAVEGIRTLAGRNERSQQGAHA